nr:unnamed protein product [Digitaria exilis]
MASCTTSFGNPIVSGAASYGGPMTSGSSSGGGDVARIVVRPTMTGLGAWRGVAAATWTPPTSSSRMAQCHGCRHDQGADIEDNPLPHGACQQRRVGKSRRRE